MTKDLFTRTLLWCVFAVTLLIFSIGISWQASKMVNFLYGFWYQTLEINSVISVNVPRNTQGKRDFPSNDTALHAQKFADIVYSIHQHGAGLADIDYLNHQGHARKLLTKSEVQHLQDVANLLDNIKILWWLNVFFLLSFLLFYCRKPTHLTKDKHNADKVCAESLSNMPSGKQKLMSLVCFMLLMLLLLSLWGFTEIFYYLHTVIFPSEHQWFFYYQDSLMATLMKAPDIFAAIAGQLLLFALLLSAIIDATVSRYQHR